MLGLKIAALYSLKPHTLGLCGPKDARRQQILRKFILGKVSPNKIRNVFKEFKGAYPYYKLIAKSNNIKDPFDEKVIRAYWIGNRLLDAVQIDNLRQMIVKDFTGPGLLAKNTAVKKAAKISNNSKPHHSFHVLKIGSITGSVDFINTELKDICRVGWGKVVKISNFQFPISNLIIEYQPLVGEKIIKFGKKIKKKIIWDREIVSKVEIGDWVSFHWGQLVEVLTKNDVKNLRKYTLNSLK